MLQSSARINRRDVAEKNIFSARIITIMLARIHMVIPKSKDFYPMSSIGICFMLSAYCRVD